MTDEEKKEGSAPPKSQGAEPAAQEKGSEAAKPAPKPAPAAKAPAKAAPPKPEPLDSELIGRLRERFGEAVGEATLDRGQAIVVVSPLRLLEVARNLRDDEGFSLLEDLTAVDWLDRSPRFDVILNLYCFKTNDRLRLKVPTDDKCPSVAGLWTTANWLERECYDMFGIQFEGHPGLTRILLPDEWSGHPLRKDYDILKQDTDWIRENLGIESGQ